MVIVLIFEYNAIVKIDLTTSKVGKLISLETLAKDIIDDLKENHVINVPSTINTIKNYTCLVVKKSLS